MAAPDVTSSGELRHEHRVILQVLSALDRHLAESADGPVPVRTLRDAVAFSAGFVDRCHHGKEEGCLFPCLQRKGMSVDGGLLAVLLEEHATGRDLVRRIGAALDRYERNEAAPGEVRDPVRAYVDLLRQHIAKEDEVLFPMGDGAMDGADHQAAADCYARREADLGVGEHHRFEHLAQAIIESDP